MIESQRVYLRKKHGRRWEYQEIEIPTDAEMERVAAELHAKHVPALITVLGRPVFYHPATPRNWSTTEVNPFTGDHGETVTNQTTGISSCTFGYRTDWQVCYFWDRGEDKLPRRIQERGDVVSRPAEMQGSLLFEKSDQTAGVDDNELLFEGATQRAELTSYERSREARKQCIKHYGVKCVVCGIDFGRVYGKMAQGFIHVHHLKSLSANGTQHEIDPIQDLRPVCPNCHAVLHMQMPPFSIAEVPMVLLLH